MPLSKIEKLHMAVFHDVIMPRLKDDKKIKEEAGQMGVEVAYSQDQLDRFIHNFSLKIVDEVAEYLKTSSLYAEANRFEVTHKSFARVNYRIDIIKALERHVKELYPSPTEPPSLAQRVLSRVLGILNSLGG